MILCIGTIADQTFCHTVKRLVKNGIHCHVVDTGLLYLSGDIYLSEQNESESFCNSYDKYRFNDYQGIYTRLIDIAERGGSDTIKKRASGFYQSLRNYLSHSSLPVLNPPIGDQSNFTKLFHSTSITLANNWLMPASCLTNDRETALQFVEKYKQVIYKGCSSAKTWARKFTADDIERLSNLENCPVLFQQMIEGPDVRIHIVGEEAFAEKIRSSSVDYRTIKGNYYEKADIPGFIIEGCRKLVAETRTPLLGIDFKIDEKSGNWYFLEANNMPCYQGYDVRSNYKISNAIKNWFIKN